MPATLTLPRLLEQAPFLRIAHTPEKEIATLPPRQVALAAFFIGVTPNRRPITSAILDLYASEWDFIRLKAKESNGRVTREKMKDARRKLNLQRSSVAALLGIGIGADDEDEPSNQYSDTAHIGAILDHVWHTYETVWRWYAAIQRGKKRGGIGGIAFEPVTFEPNCPAPECFELDPGTEIVPPLNQGEWGALFDAIFKIGMFASELHVAERELAAMN